MLSALLALAASTEPGPVEQSSPVGGSLTGIFKVDDYPADALDLNQQGSVGVLVRVDPKGAVSDCIVTSSSGSPALDAQTCRVVWLRAKFTPARDTAGRPIASTYQQRIHWGIGDDEGQTSDPYTVRWIVSEWQNGFPSCRDELGDAAATGEAGSSQCPAYIAGVPASLPDSTKPYPQIIVEQRFSVGEAPKVTFAPTDRFVGRELARLDIDASGKLTSCKVIETMGVVPPQLPRSCLISAKRYAPRKDARGSPSPFTAYYLIELYARSRE